MNNVNLNYYSKKFLKNIRMLLNEFEFVRSILQAAISFTDFAHVRSLVLGHNDKVLKQKSTIQQNKFNNLLKDKKPQHDPDNYF